MLHRVGAWFRYHRRHRIRSPPSLRNGHGQGPGSTALACSTVRRPPFTEEPFDVPAVLNNDELRDYVAVDLRLARTHAVGRAELTLYADLSNVLNRDNAAGVDYVLPWFRWRELGEVVKELLHCNTPGPNPSGNNP